MRDTMQSPNKTETSLTVKLFSETVCKDCESTAMSNTDNMGREKFWEED